MVILLFKMDTLISHVADHELKIMCTAIRCNQNYWEVAVICNGIYIYIYIYIYI